MSSGGWINTNSNVFQNSTSTDYLIRSVDNTQKVIIGNTSTQRENAGIYIKDNAVGIRKSPDSNVAFDVMGVIQVAASTCNVTVKSDMNVNNVSVTGNIVPTIDATYDLGANGYRFKDLFLTGNTIHLGETAISKDGSGNVMFLDPTSSNLKNVVVEEIQIGNDPSGCNIKLVRRGSTLYVGTDDSDLFALRLEDLYKNDEFMGVNVALPMSIIHAHKQAESGEVRIQLTDDGTGSDSPDLGVVLAKRANHTAMLWNFTGHDLNIGTKEGEGGNINIGDDAFDGKVILNGKSVTQELKASQDIGETSIVLDGTNAGFAPTNTSYAQGGRTYYIKTGATNASNVAAGDRAGLLEIGDMGGANSNDSSARGNLMVLDRFSRLWVGRGIHPGKMGSAFVGANGGSSNDSQPGIVVVGESNVSGYKLPIVHLAKDSTSADLSGFGMQLINAGTGLRIGRGNANANSGNPSFSNDVVVSNGCVGIGLSNPSSTLQLNGGALSIVNGTMALPTTGIVGGSGDKVVLAAGGASAYPYSIGVSSNTLWQSVPSGASQRWFLNGTQRMMLNSTGLALGASFSTPVCPLHVSGNSKIDGLLTTSNLLVAQGATFGTSVVVPMATVSNQVYAGSVQAVSGTLNLGTETATTTLNIGTSSGAQTINIGTGSGAKTITLGKSGDTIVIPGTTTTQNTANTTSSNKTFGLNQGGLAGTGFGAGIEVLEGGNAVGYMKVSGDSTAWLLKSPANTQVAQIGTSSNSVNLQNSVFVDALSNVGIGGVPSSSDYKLQVSGAIYASAYCNLSWENVAGVPSSLSDFSNDLSTFTNNVVFDSNISSQGAIINDLSASNAVLSTSKTTNASVSNLSASNASVGILNVNSITSSGLLGIGTDSNTNVINLGVNGIQGLINIGTNNNGTVINIGGSNDVINISGTLAAASGTIGGSSTSTNSSVVETFTYPDIDLGTLDSGINKDPNLLVSTSLSIGSGISVLANTVQSDKFRIGTQGEPNKLLTLNQDSITMSGGDVGIQIEEGGTIRGYVKTDADRTAWLLRAPTSSNDLSVAIVGDGASFNSNTLVVSGLSNGNVGIGTSSPQFKLDVAGALNATTYNNLPIASTAQSGVVMLNNTLTSTSVIQAATANTVKTLNDIVLATSNQAFRNTSNVPATTSAAGIVQLVDSFSNVSTTMSPTANALKAVYDMLPSKADKTTYASTTQYGLTQLVDVWTSGSTSNAVTAKALSNVWLAASSSSNAIYSTLWTCNATTTAKGFTTLSDAYSAGDSTKAATQTVAFNLSNSIVANSNLNASNWATFWTSCNASVTSRGTVTLSDSISTTSSALAATSTAVKAAYDRGSLGITTASNVWNGIWGCNASVNSKGVVQLSSDHTSTSETLAATCKAVNNVLAIANAKYTATSASFTEEGIVKLTNDYSILYANSNSLVPTQTAIKAVYDLAASKATPAAATSNVAGLVRLDSSLTSVNSNVAASLASVAATYALATTASNKAYAALPVASTSTQGIVHLDDTGTSSSISAAATANSVRIAMSKAWEAFSNASKTTTLPIASTALAGIVQLNNTTTSTSRTQAATANAVKVAYDEAVAKMPKTGGTFTGDVASGNHITTTASVVGGSSGTWVQLRDSRVTFKNTGDLTIGSAADYIGGTWTERMRIVNANGNVGIGVQAPSYKLHVDGDIYATKNIIAYSDTRAKTNLCEIEGALDKVKKLTGYTYELIDEEQKDKRYTGLLAQDVKSVLPEAVSETEIGMGIAYGNLAGILVQAIKEMEEKHENEIMALKKEIAALSRAM